MISDVQKLLPHRPPMVLVQRLLEIDEEARTVRCSCVAPPGVGIIVDGKVPVMILIEMLAQSSACLKGWIELQKGLPVRPAYLVRLDGLALNRAPEPGEAIEVVATEKRGLGDYFIYTAQARHADEVVASGTLRFIVDSADGPDKGA